MKIIAYYLPQYHEIPENNEWWGKGFTEWVNVKNSKPIYDGHNQPRIPLNNNYYDLTDNESLRWQAEIAKKYGVYGFCFYHYWFEGDMLLEKPASILLEDKSIDINFCFSWANHTWRRTWANKEKTVLKEQKYGGLEDWNKHFQYFLPYFKDDRYIKYNNCPILIIYNPSAIHNLSEMIIFLDGLAQANGFDGISYIYQENRYESKSNNRADLFDFAIEYQPARAFQEIIRTPSIRCKRVLNRVADHVPLLRGKLTTLTFDYDSIWNRILKQAPLTEKSIPGAFVDWDDSPRRKNRGSVTLNVTPDKFRSYLSEQIKRAKNTYNKDMIFIFAWNEWGECGYLEPDEQNEFKMLEGVKIALEENGELEV